MKINHGNENWTKTSWWEGKTWENFESCGRCVGKWDECFDRTIPELCSCSEAELFQFLDAHSALFRDLMS